MPWASSPYSQDSSTEISFSFSPSKTTSQPPTFVRGHWHVPLCTSADGSWGKPIWKIPAPNSVSCPSLMALIWACPLPPKEPILTKCGKKIVSSVFPSLLLSVAETSWLSKAYLSLKKKSLFHKESSNVFFFLVSHDGEDSFMYHLHYNLNFISSHWIWSTICPLFASSKNCTNLAIAIWSPCELCFFLCIQ